MADSVAVHTIRYKLVAAILHQGVSPTCGHYRMLGLTDGGYVIADDDRQGDYLAYPSEALLREITLLCLIRTDCL